MNVVDTNGGDVMSIGYFNGKYIPLDEPVIPIDERGHQFGDGVYEVVRVYEGKPFMLNEHIERLMNSAQAIRLNIEQTHQDFQKIIKDGIEISGLPHCSVYIQITRGVAPRNHVFPNVPVSITMTIKELVPLKESLRENGVTSIFHEDERWSNCYIKSLNLLPNILAKQAAFERGAFEAILVRDGYITEGSSSNIFMIKNNLVYTTPLSKHILAGITRLAVKQICEGLNIPVIEKSFTQEDIKHADELFLTSTTAEILPVVEVDMQKIGEGTPGPLTNHLYHRFQQLVVGKEL